MKNTINISNNANLIFNTYRCLFLKLLLRIFDSFDHAMQDQSAKQRGNGRVLKSAAFEFHKP